jgi:hypothetical protein
LAQKVKHAFENKVLVFLFMLPNCFYACAYQVHDCGFFFFVIDDKFTSYIFQDALTFQSAITLCYNT